MGGKFLRFRMFKDLYIYFFKKGKQGSVYLTGNAYHHSIKLKNVMQAFTFFIVN